ncbi:2OG-Fe(II) oxygenase [Ramlibacter sp. WS9]|uniref:2OG-Fe(II) oxygenase n=1 Tax=Ramlibacter sp. WS9 TaxID=1882741 RepID=UPI001144F952|nr:2OG-Fe(II) oxygenase [Ramlibacter sp. WS9]ROZ72657.1 2OG-Fe(II) oxygenase [Ramlibacter sp. WS9]
MSPDAAAFDLYRDGAFFDERQCGALLAELRVAPAAAATVYGRGQAGAVDERVRKVARLAPSPETVARVTQRLHDARDAVAAHFGVALTTCEDPQFLRYREGDFFVAHQDGNTGMLLSDTEQSRKISVVIFLSHQSETPRPGTHGGGALVFTEWRPGHKSGRYSLSAEAGMLVAFTADTTHEVMPVAWGDRYSIVSWYA